jgi:predicted TIM-barrel fold metal-dependent hydrolase
MTVTPVVDVNAYLGDWPFRPLRHRGPAAVRRALEGAGITRAAVSPLAAIFRQECRSANEELMQALRRRDEFFVPVPALNPAYPGWEDDLAAAIALEARGVRLFPNYHAYSLDDASARGAVQQAAAAGLAVFICLRMQDERHHHPRMMVPGVPPEQVAALASAVPEARIVVCMGRYAEAETLLGADNVWLYLSGVHGPVGCVELLAERFGPERLLMGTGAPLQYALPAVAKIHASELAQADRDKILGGNAASLLGL